jgi:hypothetical protein
MVFHQYASQVRYRLTMLGLVLLLCAPASARAAAQSDASTSPADIQRLQDRVLSLSGDLSRLRGRDANLASRLEGDLDDLRDEVIYLKVKLRKEGRVPRSEYTDLRDRLDSLGSRIRGGGDTSSAGPVAPDSRGTAVGYGTSGAPSADPTVADQNRTRSTDSTRSTDARSTDSRSTDSSRSTEPPRSSDYRRGSRDREIPVGAELDIRLQTPLSSDTAQVEDRFEATTLVDMVQGDDVLVPAGSVLRGVVSSVKKAGRLERRGSLTLSFDQITVRGRDYPIRATVTQALESEGMRGEAGKIGAGAGVGAIIGGILGGFKGALAGILIGGGGTIAATEGTDVKLDSGTVLRIRFDSPVTLDSSSSRR